MNTRLQPALSFTALCFAGLLSGLLAACGGGGGASTPPELSLGRLSPTTLQATLAESNAPNFQQFSLTASYTGTASGAVYVVVEDPDGLFTLATPSVTDTQATLVLQMGKALAAGQYTKPLTIHVCKDAACTREHTGSPQTVAKNIVVEGLGVGTTQLAFSAPVGVGAAAQPLAVTPPAGQTYDYAPTYVQFTSPTGSTSLLSPESVFNITRNATGLLIQPKGGWAGRYTWAMVLNTVGYPQKTVNIQYDVAGNSVQPFTLLNTAINATDSSGSAVFADIDVLVNLAYTELRLTITGSPDPVDEGWLLYYTSEAFTHGGASTNNAQHLRFKLDRCGYSSAFGCLAAGIYNATVQLDVTAYGQVWTYTVPVTFTVR